MKFIFPSNYSFKPKLLGIVDYNTAIFILIWSIFIFCLLNLLFTNISLKVFLFIVLCFPIFLFSIVGLNNENILYIFSYLLKFYLYKKIYLYNKDF